MPNQWATEGGRSQVVIEALSPSVDSGRFPAKREVGDTVIVEADVFADGHDSRVEWVDRPQVEREQRQWRAQRNRKLATVISLPGNAPCSD